MVYIMLIITVSILGIFTYDLLINSKERVKERNSSILTKCVELEKDINATIDLIGKTPRFVTKEKVNYTYKFSTIYGEIKFIRENIKLISQDKAAYEAIKTRLSDIEVKYKEFHNSLFELTARK